MHYGMSGGFGSFVRDACERDLRIHTTAFGGNRYRYQDHHDRGIDAVPDGSCARARAGARKTCRSLLKCLACSGCGGVLYYIENGMTGTRPQTKMAPHPARVPNRVSRGWCGAAPKAQKKKIDPHAGKREKFDRGRERKEGHHGRTMERPARQRVVPGPPVDTGL